MLFDFYPKMVTRLGFAPRSISYTPTVSRTVLLAGHIESGIHDRICTYKPLPSEGSVLSVELHGQNWWYQNHWRGGWFYTKTDYTTELLMGAIWNLIGKELFVFAKSKNRSIRMSNHRLRANWASLLLKWWTWAKLHRRLLPSQGSTLSAELHILNWLTIMVTLHALPINSRTYTLA